MSELKRSEKGLNLFVDFAAEKCHMFSEKKAGFEP